MAKQAYAETQRRILDSAAHLFAESGYKGTSTREIAQGAQVNEATMFRHFACKRELFFAVLESELQKLRLRGDLLNELAEAPDAHTALAKTFEVIATALEERGLLRFLQFSSLEFGNDFEPFLRRHLRQLIQVIIGYLQPWIDNGQLQCHDPRVVVLTFVAIVLNYSSVLPLFTDELPSLPTTMDAHADLCNMTDILESLNVTLNLKSQKRQKHFADYRRL